MKFTSQGGADVWDSKKYLNIWVCNLSGSTLGFAQFPGGPESTDGVVVDYLYFGSIGTATAPYDLGRTLTHEVGHWLNLRHIWGDSYCGNDFVDDTPTQQTSNSGCPSFPHISCNNGPNGDMFMNYMDYTHDDCLIMFTNGQKNRMIAALLNSRSELLDNNLCESVVLGCTDSTAENFNNLADSDDGSCIYSCTNFQLSVTTDCWGSETSWQITSENEIIQSIDANTLQNNINYNYDLCLLDGCYSFTIFDSYGDGLNGSLENTCDADGDYQLINDSDSVVFSMDNSNFGNEFSHDFCVNVIVYGCTDDSQYNYNELANTDDGSCIPFIYGCTDDSQYNYDELANTDDGSCIPFIYGCTDDSQYNYDELANTDDGSCIPFIYGCTDDSQYNYDELANTDDGSCIPFIYGCIDIVAENFNSLANVDDGSCNYICLNYNLTIITDLWGYETSWNLLKNQEIIEFSSINTYSNQSTNNQNFCLTEGCYEFIIYDSYGDGLEGYDNNFNDDGNYFIIDFNGDTIIEMLTPNFGFQESQEFCVSDIIYGCTDDSQYNYVELANTDDGSCVPFIYGCTDDSQYNYDELANTDDGSCIPFIYGCTDDSQYNYDELANTDNGSCIPFIYGCTDPNAGNYNVSANYDDGSCHSPLFPCDIIPNGLFVDNIIHNRVRFNWSEPMLYPSHYMIRYRPVGTNQWTVMTAGPVNDNEFSGTSRTRYFMDPETTYEWNIRSRVLNSDGSTDCQSPWSATSEYTTLPSCPNLENLSVSTEANWVTFSADAPGEEWGVWQSKAKIRELGTNSFRYANGDASGNINVLKGNFSASTSYEWHTKSWCTGNVDVDGNSDPQYHSGWGEFSSFITEEICDKLPINLSTSSNGANTAITMSWDLPLSGTPDHYFLELNNDITGQQWQWNNIAGEQTSKTKFNLSSGDYSWRIRGACGENGTSWATIFTQPEYYTLGGDRLGVGSVINDLEIYPNPSRDIFNVEFSTDEAQEVEIIVVNSIGQEIFNERVEVEGQYIKQIDLSNYSKGIYNVSLIAYKGIINQRIVLK